MTTDPHAAAGEAPRARPPCIQIRVTWGTSTMDVAHLERPRAFSLRDLRRACEPGVVPEALGDGALLAVSEAVKQGHELFNGKANCGQCHLGNNFTDSQFHNLGVGWNAATKTFCGRA